MGDQEGSGAIHDATPARSTAPVGSASRAANSPLESALRIHPAPRVEKDSDFLLLAQNALGHQNGESGRGGYLSCSP